MGVVLEKKDYFHWLNMGIGTIGYFGYGHSDENLVGIVSNIGWEPNYSIGFAPYLRYRNDIIFDQKKTILHSITFGFLLNF